VSISAVSIVWEVQQNVNLLPVNRSPQTLISRGVVSKLQFNLLPPVDYVEMRGTFRNVPEGLVVHHLPNFPIRCATEDLRHMLPGR